MRAASFASCTEQIKNEKRYAQRIGLVFSMRSGYGIGACPPGTVVSVDGSTSTHGGSSYVHHVHTQGSSLPSMLQLVLCPGALYQDLQHSFVFQPCSTPTHGSAPAVATTKTTDLCALPGRVPFCSTWPSQPWHQSTIDPSWAHHRAIDIAPNNVEPAFTPA